METEWKAPETAAVASGDPEAKKTLRSYLQRFGYIDPYRKVDEFDAEVDEPAALRALQRLHGVDVSGVYDAKTQSILNQKRCGFPDTNGVANFVLPRSKWPNRVIIWRIENSTPDMTTHSIHSAINDAIDEWDRHMPNNSFQESLGGVPDIMIKFASGDHGDGSPFDNQFGILAHAFYPPPNNGLLAGDAHFDDAEKWNEDFLMRVALHEFGHSLGLPHNLDNADSIMWPYIDPGATGTKKTLHVSDIAAITRLYA